MHEPRCDPQYLQNNTTYLLTSYLSCCSVVIIIIIRRSLDLLTLADNSTSKCATWFFGCKPMLMKLIRHLVL